jgi:hypothetical protein
MVIAAARRRKTELRVRGIVLYDGGETMTFQPEAASLDALEEIEMVGDAMWCDVMMAASPTVMMGPSAPCLFCGAAGIVDDDFHNVFPRGTGTWVAKVPTFRNVHTASNC